MALIYYHPKIKIVGECTCGLRYNFPSWTIRKATENDVREWVSEHGMALVGVDGTTHAIPKYACKCQSEGTGST